MRASNLRALAATLATAADAVEDGQTESALRDLADVERRIREVAGELGGDGANGAELDTSKYVRSLAAILDDPDATKAPEAIAQPFAWQGRVTLLAAREKVGKTTLAAYLAASVSAGRVAFPGAPR